MPSPRSRATLLVSFVNAALLVGACSGEVTAPSTTSTSTTTTVMPTTTKAASTTIPGASTTSSTPVADETVPVLLAPFSGMGPDWTEQVFPYGDSVQTLGTSPGGEGLMLGPEYGTQTPDGTWWFLDAAKQRIAHFDPDGGYLDQVMMPEDLLVDGLYFQYQMPQALDDGSIVAGGLRAEETSSLLRIADGMATGFTFDGSVPWVTTDGTNLYGQSVDDASPYRLDPDNPVGEPVDWFEARDGGRYLVTVDQDEILIELPDAAIPLTRTLQMRFSEDPGVIARGGIEVETGDDGTLFILIYGIPMSDETLDIGGMVTISPDGVVGEAEAIANPFSPADPGSPAHLGVTPGTSSPWMMVVGEDGVHVFTRSG